MHFISIESSTKNFSLALNSDAKVLRHKTITHAKLLENVILRHIDAVLKLSQLRISNMDAFVISLGPGSFTSLRVGLATVKAFCMAMKKPLVGICSLDIIAHGVANQVCDEICVIVDARRQLVYSAIYKKTQYGLTITKPYTLSSLGNVLDHVQGQTLFVGDAVGLYEQDIRKSYQKIKSGCQALFAAEKYWLPQAKVLAALGFKRLSKKEFDEPATIVPVYLYEDDCQVTKR